MSAFLQVLSAVLCGLLLAATVLGFWFYPVVTLSVMVLLLIPFVIWLFKSIGSVGTNEVALRLWFGKPEEEIFYSGLVFVPWFFNIRFNGRTLCELKRIPRSPLNLAIPCSLEDAVWSKDRQKMLVDITGFIRFPYNEPESLVKMAEADVPTEEAALQARAKPEIVAGVRDILAEYDHDQAISKSNLTVIRKGVQDFVLLPNGWFAANGICGYDPINFTPGTGEVIVRVETVKVGPELEKGMEAPVVAEYQKKAAKHQAEASAALLDDTNQALQKWLEGFELKNGRKPTEAEIKVKQEELALRRAPNFQKIRIEGLEGASTAVVGGGGTGLMIGTQSGAKNPGNPGGGQQNPPKPGNKGGKGRGNPANPPVPTDPAKLAQAADYYWRQHHTIPDFAPQGWKPPAN